MKLPCALLKGRVAESDRQGKIVILQCRTDTMSLSMIHNKRTVEPPKRNRAAAVTRPYNGHRELLDLLSPAHRSATGQQDAGGNPKIGPYTRRGAETPQRGGRFHVPLGMQRPIGAALDLKNPGSSEGCQARWLSWQDRQVPRWFVSKDSRCEASWLSRNTAATQHLH